MFDYALETYEKLPDMHFAREGFNPIMVDRFIYVFGGYDGMSMHKCER